MADTPMLELPLFDAETPPDLIAVVNSGFTKLDELISNIQADISAAEENLTTLNDKVSGIQTNVTNLQSSVSALTQRVADLEQMGIDTLPTSVLTTQGLAGVGITKDGILVNKQPE